MTGPAAAAFGDLATLASRDRLVVGAQSMSALVVAARAADPVLAAQLTPKVLLLSRSPPGVLLVGVITWLAGRYALALDPLMVDGLAAVGVLVGGYVFRCITRSPIGGLFKLHGQGG